MTAKDIIAHFKIDQLPIDKLFALRVVLDNPNDNVDLNQDVNELSLYPERLYDSYIHEWRAYVKRAIVKRVEEGKYDDLIYYLEREISIKTQSQEYKEMYAIIEQNERMNKAENVTFLTHPLKRKLFKYLK